MVNTRMAIGRLPIMPFIRPITYPAGKKPLGRPRSLNSKDSIFKSLYSKRKILDILKIEHLTADSKERVIMDCVLSIRWEGVVLKDPAGAIDGSHTVLTLHRPAGISTIPAGRYREGGR